MVVIIVEMCKPFCKKHRYECSMVMHLRDVIACLIAMAATCWVQGEVNMVDMQ